MEQFIEFIFFFLKIAVVLLALIILISYAVAISMKGKQEDKSKLKVKNKSLELEKKKQELQAKLSSDPKAVKNLKKAAKKEEKQKKQTPSDKKRLFVLDFKGDMKASQTENLSQEITSLIQVCRPGDEVILKLESPGGVVSGYGLAASELVRIKNAGLKLTVCVDKVAASGGYMMACVADHILAAPFAIIGSIGVVAQIPNFHKLLQKNHIDFEVLTAGDFKRTLTMFGENTEKGREKFVDQLEDIHALFKNFIKANRPQVDLDKVATGEFWFGDQCQELKLIDGITTSEDYIFSKHKDYDVYELVTEKKKSLMERLSEPAGQIISKKIEDLTLWNGL